MKEVERLKVVVVVRAVSFAASIVLLTVGCQSSTSEPESRSGKQPASKVAESNEPEEVDADDDEQEAKDARSGDERPASGTRTHKGVCGCEPDELCVSASSIGEMYCAEGVDCSPFDCSCFQSGKNKDPCPDDFECSSTNWPMVTCTRSQGSRP